MQNNVYLSKQSIFDIKEEITTPEIELKYNSLDQFNMSNPIFKQIINDFIVILKKNFPEEYLKNFYNNINELEVKNKGLKLSNGQYKIDKNQILIRKNIKVSEIRVVIYHELFHMSSSTYKKGRRYSGFSQRTKSRKMVVGNGINEGYTELLAHRYSIEKFDVAYLDEYNIVMYLENIVGKDEMAKLYFNADLKGLIDRLKEYSNDCEIAKFIISVDSLQKYYNEEISKIEFKQNIVNAYTFLLKTYIKKQEIEYNKKNISIEEFINRIGEYIYRLKLSPYNTENNTISGLEIKYILDLALEKCNFKEKINQKVYSIYRERC